MNGPPSSLETIALRKDYPGTIALHDISLRFDGGRIHAIIGKNGAGKSTLLKIFSGALQPTSGNILLNGREIHLRSPKDALDKGIAAVYQELSLVPGLTVAENILLGRLPKKPGFQGLIVDWRKTFALAAEILKTLHVDLDVRMNAGKLGMAQQQLVEIAKAMSFNPSVLMLDEPTSALAHHETMLLFELLRSLAARGVVILYISHRLQELSHIADTVSVLRNGALVGTIGIREATARTVVRMMFGETVQQERPGDLLVSGEPVMEVRALSRRGAFRDVSLTLYKGEILGIAGLLGSGRTELLRSLFGADPPDEGEVILQGKLIRPADPGQMKKLGVVLTPENRKEEGLVQLLSTRANMCLASLDRIAHNGFLTRGRELRVVDRRILEVDIKVADVNAPVSSLSGGNQQKVVVAKWLNTEPCVMLFDEPTRGIDIQAKQQMFQIMWDLSRRGMSCIMVSSELEELLEVCHRILIMKKGRIVGGVAAADATLEQLFALCLEDHSHS